MTNLNHPLLTASPLTLASIAYSTYYRNHDTADDMTIDDIATDIDDLLHNRNESMLFPSADELDELTCELFFFRINSSRFIDDLAASIYTLIHY